MSLKSFVFKKARKRKLRNKWKRRANSGKLYLPEISIPKHDIYACEVFCNGCQSSRLKCWKSSTLKQSTSLESQGSSKSFLGWFPISWSQLSKDLHLHTRLFPPWWIMARFIWPTFGLWLFAQFLPTSIMDFWMDLRECVAVYSFGRVCERVSSKCGLLSAWKCSRSKQSYLLQTEKGFSAF